MADVLSKERSKFKGPKTPLCPCWPLRCWLLKGKPFCTGFPPVNDVLVALEVLRRLGARVDYDATEEVAVLDTRDVKETQLPADLTNRFRASLLFVGPLLARFGRAWIQEVGGCTIGSRPTDYHYRGFARLGAEVQGVNGGGIDVVAKQLSGAFMYCDLPSHTGVETSLWRPA